MLYCNKVEDIIILCVNEFARHLQVKFFDRSSRFHTVEGGIFHAECEAYPPRGSEDMLYERGVHSNGALAARRQEFSM